MTTTNLARFLLLLLAVVPLLAQDEEKAVTVLGLGMMGKALVTCYQSNGYKVHAWNRGASRRDGVQKMALDGVTVHDEAQEAVEATDTIIVMFASEPELKSVIDFVKSIPKAIWKGKTMVNFASHEPFAARNVEVILKDYSVEHVAGAMIAVPENICGGAGALVLTSAPDRSTKAFEEVTPTLEALGRLESFPGDVGYGSLVDIGLIQTLLFGMSGFELSLLFLEKYGLPDKDTDRFVDISKEIFPGYFPFFFQITADSVRGRNWEKGYMTAKATESTLAMHGSFLKKIGIADDNLNNIYLKYMKKTVEAEPETGISSVLKHLSVDDYSFSDKKDEL